MTYKLMGNPFPEVTGEEGSETCPVCGQPDNCGDCTHEPVDEPHDCAENAVECGTGPNVSGVLHLWDECGVCGHQFNHRTDSVL